MASSSGIAFSLTTLGAVALIVACSPNNNGKLAIGARSPTAFQKAISACTDGLRPSEKRKLKAGHSVDLCEIPLKADGTPGDKPVLTPNDISYSIQKDDDSSVETDSLKPVGGRGVNHGQNRVHLAMSVELASSTALTDKEQSSLAAEFMTDCGRSTQAIFSRSRVSGGPQLSLSLNIEVSDPATETLDDDAATATSIPDQILRISKSTDGVDSIWILNQLPAQPKFYPVGKTTENKACAAAGGTSQVQLECKLQKRQAANLVACAAFAKRVGNSLGIVDTTVEHKTCGVAPLVGAASTAEPSAAGTPPTFIVTSADVETSNAETTPLKPAPQPSGDSTFAKPSTSDDEFLNKSTLNKKDLLTILSPACPNLKDPKLKDAK